ncbi:MAG: hypothetical protein ACERKD_19100 [Prolixibacteraceae bacterium]
MAGKVLKYFFPMLINLLNIGFCYGNNPETITKHISLEILPGGAFIAPPGFFLQAGIGITF